MATTEIDIDILSLIGLGTLVMVLLMGGMVTFIVIYQKRMIQAKENERLRDEEYQTKMIQLQLESQEDERKRIAADLHDSVGSLLWGAKLTAAYIQRSVDPDETEKKSHTELMEILDQSIQTVKRIAWELTPEAFHYSGLSRSLASLCARLDGKGMVVQFTEEGESVIWNDDRALLLFRIVQELVSNGIKHSQASNLTVKFSWASTLLIVEVSDNGKGFSLDAKREGIGWWNIHHRAKQLNAEISIGEIPIGQGSLINLKVPLLHAE